MKYINIFLKTIFLFFTIITFSCGIRKQVNTDRLYVTDSVFGLYLNQRFAAYQQEFYQKTFEQTEVEFYLPETLSTRIEVPILDTLVKVKPLLQEFAQPIKRITTTVMKQEKTLESSKDTTATLLQVSEQKATEEIHQEEKPGKAFSKGRYIGLIIGIIALCVLLTVLRFKK